MSSKSYNISGSKYGAVDTENGGKPESVVPLATEPPKPAVRQRIQDKTNRNPPCSPDQAEQVAKIASESQAVQGAACKAYKNLAFQETEPPDDMTKELSTTNTEINNSSVAIPATTRSKNSFLLPLPTNPKGDADDADLDASPSEPTRPYPKKVLFIVGNEFCERFSYYGLRAILVLYFKSVLGLSDSTSTVSFHLFATLCYLSPILGAILGDSIWGKFKTIFYLSIVYFLGEVTLVLSSVFWNEGAMSTGLTFFGLFLIGVGTGGIKPCVSALGGDQFYPNEEQWRQNFFSLFYGAINLGSLISMFLTPMLRSDFNCVNRSDCYPYAFGLPCALMFVGIVVFLMAKNQYVLVPLPEQNVIVAFCHCTYLALKRKILCQKPDLRDEPIVKMHRNSSQSEGSTSSSSVEETEDDAPVASIIQQPKRLPNESAKLVSDVSVHKNKVSEKNIVKRKPKSKHWLYLASDQYDKNSIEDFRSVWNIMLIFAPTSVYWCLFDQQGSLWTLQAARMDGRVFNTGFTLQPDQMSVANPLLLLASIPLFQMIIYPSLGRCGVLKKPIQRMAAGGLLAALTFVVFAMIEIRIQEFAPAQIPSVGKANLLIVNGLTDCSITSPTVSFTSLPLGIVSPATESNSSLPSAKNETDSNILYSLGPLNPLMSRSIEVESTEPQTRLASGAIDYKLRFKLSNSVAQSNNSVDVVMPQTSMQTSGCPLSPQLERELNIGLLPEQSSRLLYITQGNGKLTHKTFPDSMVMPEAGKARVQLLYDSFGPVAQTNQRIFYLVRLSTSPGASSPVSQMQQNTTFNSELQFSTSSRDGQVILSHYLDVPVPGKGDLFSLRTSDSLIGTNTQQPSLLLKPGTRNLIVVHQMDASKVEIKQELLVDNDYRISMLYQLVPYLLISMSEVMLSITGIEFSYASAPSNMKSVILGAWSLMVALGNLMTVAIESVHPFDNVAHDFLFYAAIMGVDMILFAYIGFRYKPYKRQLD